MEDSRLKIHTCYSCIMYQKNRHLKKQLRMLIKMHNSIAEPNKIIRRFEYSLISADGSFYIF